MDLRRLCDTNDGYVNEVFKIITASGMLGDSEDLNCTSQQIQALQTLMEEEVHSRLVSAGQSFHTPKEAKEDMLWRMAGDDQYRAGVSNPGLKWGTNYDPTVYSHTSIPVTFGPTEAAAVYATGGLASDIIDKKSRAMILKGATFKTLQPELWGDDAISKLEAAAQETGLNDVGADAITDAFLQGGSVLYPVFTTDTRKSLGKQLDKLPLEPGCIARWVTTDRWNVTFVPSFIVTAADYLRPEHILIPMSNAVVHTSRCAMIRPKSLPYWAALYNLGWCPSDLSGWIRAYYAYEITMMSIPVMAQQSSLLLYRMPLDGLNATIGPSNVRKLMEINEENMATWNALNPKAINMIGEVEVVERTYAGLDLFVGAVKSELAAQCGIPEPSLWHTPNKGFSDNTTESLLKQSEALQMSQQVIEKAMGPVRDCLIAHVFGINSKEWENRKTIKLSFDKPVISTEADLAKVGAQFAAAVNSFVAAGVAPDIAVEMSKPFFPSVHITDDMIKRVKKSYEEKLDRDERMAKEKAANPFGGSSSSGNGTKGKAGGQYNQKPQLGHGMKGATTAKEKV